eukprot:SAG31_NODE_1902_length_6956_cov_5.312236_3_plen_82_part_00
MIRWCIPSDLRAVWRLLCSGLGVEHFAQLYLDGGAWAATLEPDFKSVFGSKRVQLIAPPAQASTRDMGLALGFAADGLDEV